jgi:hypothetical protein
VDWELRNTEAEAGRRLMKAQSIDDAAFAMAGFERPRGWKGCGATDPSQIHGWNNRLGNAKRQYGVAAAFAAGGKDPNLPDVDVSNSREYREWQRGLSGEAQRAVDLVVGGSGSSLTGSAGGLPESMTPPEELGMTRGQARRAGFRDKLGDILGGAAAGLAAGAEKAPLPEMPDFEAQRQAWAESAETGPLPRLGEGPLFRGLFG